jgi:hypothetical protein
MLSACAFLRLHARQRKALLFPLRLGLGSGTYRPAWPDAASCGAGACRRAACRCGAPCCPMPPRRRRPTLLGLQQWQSSELAQLPAPMPIAPLTHPGQPLNSFWLGCSPKGSRRHVKDTVQCRSEEPAVHDSQQHYASGRCLQREAVLLPTAGPHFLPLPWTGT